MDGLISTFRQFVRDSSNIDALILLVIGGLVGFLLKQFLPFLARQSRRLLSLFARLLGGRLAHRAFEGKYLDWLSIELRELKLPGIVTAEIEKRPHLEQVFVSLRLTPTRYTESQKNLQELIATRITPILTRGLRRFSNFNNLANEVTEVFIESGVIDKVQARSTLVSLRFEPPSLQRPPGLKLLARVYALVRSLLYRDPTRMRLQLTRTVLERLSPSAVLNHFLQTRRRLAILGGPGSGKTTLLQYIGLTYAKERAGDPSIRHRGILRKRIGVQRWRLPVFIPLASVAAELEVKRERKNKKPSLIELAVALLPPDLEANPVASSYLRKKIESGEAVILLDGLDEVPGEKQFAEIVEALEGLAVSYPKNQYLITSRETGWRSGVGADFDIAFVDDLDDDQVDRFIEAWYDAVERNAVVGRLADEPAAERAVRERRALTRATELKDPLRNNERIRRLAANPMLLSIIALVHRTLATLPRERAKLYAECSKVLLEQWDISKGVALDDTGLKLEQKEALLRQVAIAFHQGEIAGSEGGREAAYAAVLRKVRGLLPSLGRGPDEAERLLARLIERSGLLIERRRGVLSFSHLTFQEYFAAQYLATEEITDDLLGSFVRSDWWREVLLLYAGLIGDATEFLDYLLSLPDEKATRPITRLAAQALGEAVEVRDTTIRRFILQKLARVKLGGPQLPDEILERKQVTEFLSRWAGDEEDWNRAAASLSVQEILQRPGKAEGLEHLMVPLLESKNDEEKLAALEVISRMEGADTPLAIRKALSEMLLSDELQVRRAVVKTLDPRTEWGHSELLRIVRQGEAEGGLAASRLAKIGENSDALCRELLAIPTGRRTRAEVIAGCPKAASSDDLRFHFELVVDSVEEFHDREMLDHSIIEESIFLVENSPYYAEHVLDIAEGRNSRRDDGRWLALELLGFVSGHKDLVRRALEVLVRQLEKGWAPDSVLRNVVYLVRRGSRADREYIKELAFSGSPPLKIALLRSFLSMGIVLEWVDLPRLERLIWRGRRGVDVAAVQALAAESNELIVRGSVHALLNKVLEQSRRRRVIAALWVIGERRWAADFPRSRLERCLSVRSPGVFSASALAIFRSEKFFIRQEEVEAVFERLSKKIYKWRWELSASVTLRILARLRRFFGRMFASLPHGYYWWRYRFREFSEETGALLFLTAAATSGQVGLLSDRFPIWLKGRTIGRSAELLSVAILAAIAERRGKGVVSGVDWKSLEFEMAKHGEFAGTEDMGGAYYYHGPWDAGAMRQEQELREFLPSTEVLLAGVGGTNDVVLVRAEWWEELVELLLRRTEDIGGINLLRFVWSVVGPLGDEARASLLLHVTRSVRNWNGSEVPWAAEQLMRVGYDGVVVGALEVAEREVAEGKGGAKLVMEAVGLLAHRELRVREMAWRVLAASQWVRLNQGNGDKGGR